MDHLARPDEGNYIEIQSGIAPTQNQKFLLAGNSEIHWTESYGALSVDPSLSHAADYQNAVEATGRAVDRRFPGDELDEIDLFMRQISILPADERLSVGSGWGARDEQIAGRRLADGLDFSGNKDAPDAWDELAGKSPFSEKSLASLPSEFVVTERWCKALSEHANEHGDTWLHELALGIAALDRGEVEQASVRFERSLAMKETWLGYRQRALVAATSELVERAYLQAWSMADAPPELAEEIAEWLQKENRIASLTSFLSILPKNILERERVILSRANAAAHMGSVKDLEALLSRDFATIREGETLLEDLWLCLQRNKVYRQLGHEPTKDEIEMELKMCPLPTRLDFRMSS